MIGQHKTAAARDRRVALVEIATRGGRVVVVDIDFGRRVDPRQFAIGAETPVGPALAETGWYRQQQASGEIANPVER